MTDFFRDTFELARRLDVLRQAPPTPLPLAHHDRDGPDRHPESLARKESHHGPPGASGHAKPVFNWKSKGF